MVAVPLALPLTVAEDPEPLTEANVGLALLHEPPVEVLDKVIVAPTQTADGPLIAFGVAGGPTTVKLIVRAVEPQKLETV